MRHGGKRKKQETSPYQFPAAKNRPDLSDEVSKKTRRSSGPPQATAVSRRGAVKQTNKKPPEDAHPSTAGQEKKLGKARKQSINWPCIHKRRTGPTNNGPQAERMPHDHILTKANESGCEKLRAYKSSPRGQCLGERGHSQPVRPFNETQVLGQRLARLATLPLRTAPGSRKKLSEAHVGTTHQVQTKQRARCGLCTTHNYEQGTDLVKVEKGKTSPTGLVRNIVYSKTKLQQPKINPH